MPLVVLIGFDFLIAILQVYIFTILACIYLNDAVNSHQILYFRSFIVGIVALRSNSKKISYCSQLYALYFRELLLNNRDRTFNQGVETHSHMSVCILFILIYGEYVLLLTRDNCRLVESTRSKVI
jgi:hypothetical protein